MLGGINNALFLSSFAGFAVLGFLIVMLRWAFSRGSSVVEKPLFQGNENEYGLLEVVAKPLNHIEGEMLRQKLLAVKIRAMLTQTNDGPRIFVFPEEESAARAHLKSFS